MNISNKICAMLLLLSVFYATEDIKQRALIYIHNTEPTEINAIIMSFTSALEYIISKDELRSILIAEKNSNDNLTCTELTTKLNSKGSNYLMPIILEKFLSNSMLKENVEIYVKLINQKSGQILRGNDDSWSNVAQILPRFLKGYFFNRRSECDMICRELYLKFRYLCSKIYQNKKEFTLFYNCLCLIHVVRENQYVLHINNFYNNIHSESYVVQTKKIDEVTIEAFDEAIEITIDLCKEKKLKNIILMIDFGPYAYLTRFSSALITMPENDYWKRVNALKQNINTICINENANTKWKDFLNEYNGRYVPIMSWKDNNALDFYIKKEIETGILKKYGPNKKTRLGYFEELYGAKIEAILAKYFENNLFQTLKLFGIADNSTKEISETINTVDMEKSPESVSKVLKNKEKKARQRSKREAQKRLVAEESKNEMNLSANNLYNHSKADNLNDTITQKNLKENEKKKEIKFSRTEESIVVKPKEPQTKQKKIRKSRVKIRNLKKKLVQNENSNDNQSTNKNFEGLVFELENFNEPTTKIENMKQDKEDCSVKYVNQIKHLNLSETSNYNSQRYKDRFRPRNKTKNNATSSVLQDSKIKVIHEKPKINEELKIQLPAFFNDFIVKAFDKHYENGKLEVKTITIETQEELVDFVIKEDNANTSYIALKRT